MIGNQCLQRSNCSALSIHSCPLVCIRCRSKKTCKTTPLHSQTSDGWRFSNIGIVSHITSLMRSQVSLSTRSESWTGTSISKTSLVGKEHDQHWDVRGTGKQLNFSESSEFRSSVHSQDTSLPVCCQARTSGVPAKSQRSSAELSNLSDQLGSAHHRQQAVSKLPTAWEPCGSLWVPLCHLSLMPFIDAY